MQIQRFTVLLFAVGVVLPAVATGEPEVAVDVRLDPASHRLDATAVVRLADLGGEAPTFRLHPGVSVSAVRIDSNDVPFETTSGDDALRVVVRPEGERKGPASIELVYGGVIHDPPRSAGFSREWISDAVTGTIQAEGAFLSPSAGWYPAIDPLAPASYEVRIVVPEGWEAVSEGSRRVEPDPSGGRVVVYRTRDPVEGAHLVAGPWTRIARRHGDVEIALLVTAANEDLAETYLPAVERYLDLYSEWLGPYPYDRFDVVENFFPTGYGMPGYTVLGARVLRLPFIVHTSLGHEVAHNWWGNGVYVDESGGNWCEGLTTFVADYHYKGMQGEDQAAEYRREAARAYSNYVAEAGQDLALSEFTQRSDPASRSVGYGKAMMVFHMLERRLGKAAFDGVLREVYSSHLHRPASWATWERAFSKAAGEDLGWFFDQWVRRAGAPALRLEGVTVARVAEQAGEDAWEVRGVVRQEPGKSWRLRVPLWFEAAGDRHRRTLEVEEDATPFRVRLPFRPEVVRGDPEQDLFRRLSPDEMPAILSGVLGDPDTLVVIAAGTPDAVREVYGRMAADIAKRRELDIVDEAEEVPVTDGRSVLLLGLPRPESALAGLTAGIPAEVRIEADGFEVSGETFDTEGGAVLAVGRHPSDSGRSVAVFHALGAPAAEAAGPKLVHYGKYSFLGFVSGENRAKGVARVEGGPLVHRISPAATP